MPASPAYTIVREGRIWVVRFSVPTLSDPELLHDLTAALTALVKQDDFHGLLLNMEGVTFIVSAFLNVLLKVDREMPPSRKPIRICCPNFSVHETFQLTRLHTKFPLFADQPAALAMFRQR
jgi:anti-anti-sigma factor